MADQGSPSRRASQLQEAIDTIVQSFDHPDSVSLEYSFEGGQKRTELEIVSTERITIYELIYNTQDDEAEPELTQIE